MPASLSRVYAEGNEEAAAPEIVEQVQAEAVEGDETPVIDAADTAIEESAAPGDATVEESAVPGDAAAEETAAAEESAALEDAAVEESAVPDDVDAAEIVEEISDRDDTVAEAFGSDELTLYNAAEGDYEYADDGIGVKLTKYTGSAANVTIPATLGGKSVLTIAKDAFKDNTTITSVVIPEGVKKIEAAFVRCTALTSVTIPSTIESTGTSYESIDGKKVYCGPFGGCDKLTKVEFAQGIKLIPNDLFSYCSGLTEITIPSTVIKIGAKAFYDDYNLAKVDMQVSGSNGVTEIGGEAFANCIKLNDLKIADTVQKIGGGAFVFCTSLTSVTIPSSIENCGTSYESIDGKKVYCGPFGGCDKLTKVELAQGIKIIPNSLFAYTTNFTEITIPSTVTKIGSSAFEGARKLEKVDMQCADGKGVTEIGSGAFADCINLKDLKIADTVQKIGSGAFIFCTSLTSVTIPSSIESVATSYQTIDGKKVYCGPFGGCEKLTKVELAQGIKTIPSNLFAYTTSITEVPEIPSTVTTIGENAFAGTDVKEIKMSEGVQKIDKNAFKECKNLTKITIPKSVTTIGKDATKDCSASLELQIVPGSKAGEEYAKANNIPYVSTDPSSNSGGTGGSGSGESGNGGGNGGGGETYAIAYKNGGDVNPNPDVYTKGVALVLKDPERAGYKFGGWYTNSKFKKSSKVEMIKESSVGSKVLYAKWTAQKYTIEYDSNPQGIVGAAAVNTDGISGKTKATKSVKIGAKATLRANGFKYKGYTFAGWNTKPDGTGIAYKNKAKAKNIAIIDGKFSDTVTLYAQWKEVNYSVSYKWKGGTAPGDYTKKYTISTESFKLPVPEKSGYVFDGWYTKSNCKGDPIEYIEKGTAKKMTLYAKWVKE